MGLFHKAAVAAQRKAGAYNAEGFDMDGYDRWGYDRDGIDREGRDRRGYSAGRNDRNRYNQWGYDRNGRDRGGYNREGFTNLWSVHDPGAYDSEFHEWDREPSTLYYLGPSEKKLVSYSASSPCWDESKCHSYYYSGKPSKVDEVDRRGFNRRHLFRCPWSKLYDREPYDMNGYDWQGFDERGFNKSGIQRNGGLFDKTGHDIYGFGLDGFNDEGYNVRGFDRQGFDRWGRDINGCNKDGVGEDGYDALGFDAEGYDRDGYDKNGKNRAGVSREEYGFLGGVFSAGESESSGEQARYQYAVALFYRGEFKESETRFRELGSYWDSERYAELAKHRDYVAHQFDNPQVGQIVYFGHYPQGKNGEVEEIQWLVVGSGEDNEERWVSVISLFGLDARPFSADRSYRDSAGRTSFYGSPLYAWLNGGFKDRAFTESEKEKVRSVRIPDTPFSHKLTSGPNNPEKCRPTAFAKASGAATNGFGMCQWWTYDTIDSPGKAWVHTYRGEKERGDALVEIDRADIAVRPSIAITLWKKKKS